MKNGKVPSEQVRGYRRVTSIPLTADNQQFTVDLPRGAAIENAVIVVNGTFNVSAGAATVRGLAPTQLISRVDWIINGNITLHSASGLGSYVNSWKVNRQLPALLAPTTGTGAKTLSAEIRLDRVFNDMYRPKDSVLKTDENVTTNQLRITTSTLSGLYVAGATATYTSMTLDVYVQDYQQAPARDSGRTPMPLWYPKISEQVVTFTGTGDQAPIRINTGNRLRMLILRQEVNGEGTDSQLANVRVIRSGDTRVDMPATALQFKRAQDFGPNGLLGTAQATGLAVLDFANPGLLAARYSEFWPLPSNADAQLLVNAAVAHSLRIITVEGVDLQAA